MNQPPAMLIPLDEFHTTIVDPWEYDQLMDFKWYAARSQRCWYAKTTIIRDGHKYTRSMHRLIANTPEGQICHHRNRNTLDNRKINLLNLPPKTHQMLHQNHTLIIKFEQDYSTPIEQLGFF